MEHILEDFLKTFIFKFSKYVPWSTEEPMEENQRSEF